ncbi:MAG: FG-GAP-like repeat-containing protein, partial [Terracidiphilus sp.]|nr:FG-GAP-like repeat-containing protein [Terracidiphilus sp.]
MAGGFSAAVTITDNAGGSPQSFALGGTGVSPIASVSLAVTAAGSPVTTVAANTTVSLTARVMADGAAVSPGQVSFCDASAAYCTGTHLLGTAQLKTDGTAGLKLRPAVGSHTYKAVFLGTPYGTSCTSGTAALSVTGLLSSATTATASSTSALTAAVGGNGNVAPTGTVSYLDVSRGNAVLGTATLGAGAPGLRFFGASSTPAGTVQQQAMEEGDFNGDGIPDLVLASNGASGLTVLLGNGDGTFSVAPAVPAGPACSVAIGDFNGDGNLDLAVTSYNTASITVLRGNGDGTFAVSTTYPAAGTCDGIVAGDFNGDGILDLVDEPPSPGWGQGEIKMLMGNGDGTFTPGPTTTGLGGWQGGLAAVDLNGDGKLDLAVVVQITWGWDGGEQGSAIDVLLGKGDGTFTAPGGLDFEVYSPSPQEPPAGSLAYAIAATDLNGDGIPDLVVSDANSSYTGAVTVLLGNGDGSFGWSTPSFSSNSLSGIDTGDFNGDGKQDIAYLHWGSSPSNSQLGVLLGNGDGTYTAGPPNAEVSPFTPGPFVAADFNGSGVSSLASSQVSPGGGPNTVVALLAENQTATTAQTSISVPAATDEIVAVYSGDSNYASSTSSLFSLSAVGLSATSLSFGDWEVGAATASQSVTLTNTGTLPLSISSISVTGANASSFVFANSCGTSVAGGASCRIHGHFAPTTTGALSAAVMIADNAADSPQTIALSGTGISSNSTTVEFS